MKPNLGKFFVSLLFFTHISHATPFTYRIDTDTDTPYLKAPVHLTVELNQTDPKPVLLFDFSLRKKPAYRIEQFRTQTDDTPHHTHHRYEYLLYPLQEGNLTVDFRLIQRISDDEKIAYFFSGDRDDFKKLETVDSEVKLPPVTLHVRPLPPKTELVGDFTLHHDLSAEKTQAYTPVSLHIVLEGEGYPPIVKRLLPPIQGVKVFADKPRIERRKTDRAIHYRITYTYALSAAESFTIPQRALIAFDPRKERRYTLTLPRTRIDVSPVDAAALVDKRDTPPLLKAPSYRDIFDILGYFVAFAAGWIAARIAPSFAFGRNTKRRDDDPFVEALKRTEDPKALLRLLLAADDRRFDDAIGTLEAHLYEDAPLDFKALKRRLQTITRKNNDA